MNNLIELFKEQHNLCANDMAGGDYNFQYIKWLEGVVMMGIIYIFLCLKPKE